MEGRNGEGVTRHWSYISKTCLGDGVTRSAFTSRRLLRKIFRGLHKKVADR
jgi:hypothetical protein